MLPVFRLLPAVFVSLVVLVMASPASARFKDLTPSADAHVASGNPTTNYGGNGTLFVQDGAPSDSFGDERVWLKFNLNGQLPSISSSAISSAKLRLYLFVADNASTGNDLPIEVHGASDDSWDEATITWNSQPAFSDGLPADAVGTLDANKEFLWYEFDVTALVQSQADSDGVVSLVLKAVNESLASSSSFQYRFNSREFLRDGYSLVPRLRVEFSGDWPSANAINVIHTNDLHSRLTTHDLDFPDANGQLPAMEEAGGAALVAAKVVELKKARPGSLYIDAGDVSEGNPLGDLRGNGGTVDFFQTLDARLKALPNNTSGRGVDAVVVGNHDIREFEMLENMKDPDGDGIENTPATPNADPDDVPFLAVNVLDDGASKPAPAAWPAGMPFRPYVVIDVDGTRVGVLGYLTDDSAILTAETENVIDVLETAWTDKGNGVAMANVVVLKDWVDHLRTVENVDVVILLSHIGQRRLNSDGDLGFGDGNDELLGDMGGAVAPPDLVVSGHWHTWTATAWQPGNLNYKTSVVEAASYGQYVGEVQITTTGRYLGATKHPIRVSDFTIPHPDLDVDAAYNAVVALLGTLEAEYAALTGPDCIIDAATVQAQVPGYVDGRPCPLDFVVGHSAVDLTLDKDKWFTLSEFPWSGDNTVGAWIADAMVDKVRSIGLNGGVPSAADAHLAIQSGGGIRRDIAAGPITYREIFEAYPWDDDAMVRVQMTSADVWSYIEQRFVGSSISADWRVTADDGQVTAIDFDADGNGSYETAISETDTVTTWNVIISEYMYENDNWISETGGTNDGFKSLDPTPEFIANDGTTSSAPVVGPPGPLEIRDSVVEYTAQFQAGNPMTIVGPRYLLNTEVAGEFEAVVTMTADAETQPYFEGVFVRLLQATPETLWRRNLPGDPYNLTGLVNADGSIDPQHELAETLWYRSHLGFPDGYLQVGDRVMLRGEFGFFEGNAQFVEQEGVIAAETEFEILGNDPLLALPNYFARTADILVEDQENRLVTFFAQRAGDNTVQDAAGDVITLYREGGFFSSSTYLPGSNGDCLKLTGVSTERADSSPVRRFRLRDAETSAACFAPSSMVTAVSGDLEVGKTITLEAMAEDLNGVAASGTGSYFAGMDLDGEGAALPLTMTFSGIDISGQTGLTFRIRAAEDDASDGNEDWDSTDYVHIDYQIDGGGYQNLLHFENDGSQSNSAASVDTDFNGIGDGAVLTDVFTAFSQAIAGTGSTLDIRITFRLDAGDEDIAIDDVEILNGSQTTIFLEDFEDASVGYTTSVPEFTDGGTDFFVRTDGSDHSAAVAYQAGAGGQQLFGTITQVLFEYSTDGGQTWLAAGNDIDGQDGWSAQFVPALAGDYLFRSIAYDNDATDLGTTNNVEPAPLYADAFATVLSAPPPPMASPRRVPLLGSSGEVLLLLLMAALGAALLAARARPGSAA